jgi:hypothetical protein
LPEAHSSKPVFSLLPTHFRPLVVFNGELDRIRGGYYPSFAFGELSKLSKDFIPKVVLVS